MLSSGKLDTIADARSCSRDRSVLPADQARASAQIDAGSKGETFGTELVRLMTAGGPFRASTRTACASSRDTAYAAQVTLPSDVANGPFLAHTHGAQGQATGRRDAARASRCARSGFENFVFVARRQQPLLYGLVCVVLALGTGWLAGVVFRR